MGRLTGRREPGSDVIGLFGLIRSPFLLSHVNTDGSGNIGKRRTSGTQNSSLQGVSFTPEEQKDYHRLVGIARNESRDTDEEHG